MRKLPKYFKQITTLQALDKYLSKDQITVKITFFGGRKYVHKNSKGDFTGDFSLNDFVRLFGKRFYISQYGGGKYPKKNRQLVSRISSRLNDLDAEGQNKLKEKGWLTRQMHKFLKSDVVLKTKGVKCTRKNVLSDIDNSLKDLETRENQIVLQVKTAFDESFGTGDDDRTLHPTLTQEIDDTKSALTEFVKDAIEEKAKLFMIKVKQLSESAKKLSGNDRLTFNKKLIELINKLVTDKNGTKLSAFMFAAYCNAITKDPLQFVAENQELEEKIREYDIFKNYFSQYYKKYKKNDSIWWPPLTVEKMILSENVQRCSDSFE